MTTTSANVRRDLVDALRLDLIGPGEKFSSGVSFPDLLEETLTQDPSKWYLTGLLIPKTLPVEERESDDGHEDLETGPGEPGTDDNSGTTDRAPANACYLPSSMGLSLIVRTDASELTVGVRWGDYRPETLPPEGDRTARGIWVRTQREEQVRLPLPLPNDPKTVAEVPSSNGLRLVASARPVRKSDFGDDIQPHTSAVSVFLVNEREVPPQDPRAREMATVFQAQLDIECSGSIVARPNVRGVNDRDADERIADLQYSDACEFAVGHNVAVEADYDGSNSCSLVRTCWIPCAYVHRVVPGQVTDVPFSMEVLAQITHAEEAIEKLLPLVNQYRTWIAEKRALAKKFSGKRSEVSATLLTNADRAANRIEEGIQSLATPTIFEAFVTANRVMAVQAARRLVIQGKNPAASPPPTWRPFQLAFILMNVPGIVNPTHSDRESVDLLFFPTGGGKTEAYLGLAAFTLVHRRLSHSGIASAGLSVLMRYTLRLLTLDQLSRASTMICALELDRKRRPEVLGEWPFEIGLWVGSAATPNKLGRKGDSNAESARARVKKFQDHPESAPSPIPLENCPWCGAKFSSSSFQLEPNPDEPRNLAINCMNSACDFTRGRYLPLVTVDEPIYRRLPCFMIATVDKFAGLPWTGDTGQFFGNVQRWDKSGFYGEMAPGVGQKIPVDRLPPPDLIIQDELHLISGPLGTIAGLYEAAIDRLASYEIDGRTVRPKIIASTATVRQAAKQARALFGRAETEVFPPPGLERGDSFFAVTKNSTEEGRLYLGVAAQGRSPKVMMLKIFAALLSAAKMQHQTLGGDTNSNNPADPYMTVLGYFNSLRELGGARRIVDDEVSNRTRDYSMRHRFGQKHTVFADREISDRIEELTSRATTAEVAVAKEHLERRRTKSAGVDVALATNMISVGLDIQRLGLMVVMGQPLTTSEYIQATSRVGRDFTKPGIVVTLLNIHKPRDRSHYERFQAYHETFYRSVEAASVTPYSPRALDRALAAAVVSIARHGWRGLTRSEGAHKAPGVRTELSGIAEYMATRANMHDVDLSTEDKVRISESVRRRVSKLLDYWVGLVEVANEGASQLRYNKNEDGKGPALLHQFLDAALKDLDARYDEFRANRSMRDVEPGVNVFVKSLVSREG